MAIGKRKDQFQKDYIASKTVGYRSKADQGVGAYEGHDAKMWKRRRRANEQWGSDKAHNKRVGAEASGAFDKAFGNREVKDFSGMNFEKRYGTEAADTIMGAFTDGDTGMLSTFDEGEGGSVTENRFGDIAETAGRIKNRRDIKETLSEGKYAGGTGALNSASGGAGFNILATGSQAAKKKKKPAVGYTANDSNQLYNAAAMG